MCVILALNFNKRGVVSESRLWRRLDFIFLQPSQLEHVVTHRCTCKEEHNCSSGIIANLKLPNRPREDLARSRAQADVSFQRGRRARLCIARYDTVPDVFHITRVVGCALLGASSPRVLDYILRAPRHKGLGTPPRHCPWAARRPGPATRRGPRGVAIVGAN